MFTGKWELFRQDVEDLKTQQALNSQAIKNHMENEEVLMKAHNKKLDNIIDMIKDANKNHGEFREKVEKNYVTKNELDNLKKALGWVVAAIVTACSLAAGAYSIYSDIHQRFEDRLHHYEEMRHDGKSH